MNNLEIYGVQGLNPDEMLSIDGGEISPQDVAKYVGYGIGFFIGGIIGSAAGATVAILNRA